MDQLIEINSLEEYEKAIQTKSIILFTASWCPDCMFIQILHFIVLIEIILLIYVKI